MKLTQLLAPMGPLFKRPRFYRDRSNPVRTRREREDNSDLPEDDPPYYFNTGCCSFGDGDVTGLELSSGQIRLVRWLSDTGQARPKELTERDLPEMLDLLSGTSAGAGGLPGTSHA
jgi:hypothetical protein